MPLTGRSFRANRVLLVGLARVRVAETADDGSFTSPMITKAGGTFQFDAIDDVVSDIAKGRIVIVTDDADRENEGDLVIAAEKVTPEAVDFVGHIHGRGLICVPIWNERAEQLGLQRMVAQNREGQRTDFTVSVDAARGVTTGISAYDRATTILAIANSKSAPDDLTQPGHVFPLRAKDGGVLRRAGHTEAAVDLARMAGLQPAGVLCEILHDDGTMARLPELMEFRKKHGLRICTIHGVTRVAAAGKLIELEQCVEVPTDYGNFDLAPLPIARSNQEHHLALVKGEIEKTNRSSCASTANACRRRPRVQCGDSTIACTPLCARSIGRRRGLLVLHAVRKVAGSASRRKF